MVKKFRRVVIGTDKSGDSTVVEDTLVAGVNPLERVSADATLADMWCTREAPAKMQDFYDPNQTPVALAPAKAGTILRMFELPPEATYWHKLTDKVLNEIWGNLDAEIEIDIKKMRHPFMHTTKTIDYIIILSGEIYAILEKGEVCLKAGDVLIQRGTSHAWANRSDKPCIMAAILIDAE